MRDARALLINARGMNWKICAGVLDLWLRVIMLFARRLCCGLARLYDIVVYIARESIRVQNKYRDYYIRREKQNNKLSARQRYSECFIGPE